MPSRQISDTVRLWLALNKILIRSSCPQRICIKFKCWILKLDFQDVKPHVCWGRSKEARIQHPPSTSEYKCVWGKGLLIWVFSKNTVFWFKWVCLSCMQLCLLSVLGLSRRTDLSELISVFVLPYVLSWVSHLFVFANLYIVYVSSWWRETHKAASTNVLRV